MRNTQSNVNKQTRPSSVRIHPVRQLVGGRVRGILRYRLSAAAVALVCALAGAVSWAQTVQQPVANSGITLRTDRLPLSTKQSLQADDAVTTTTQAKQSGSSASPNVLTTTGGDANAALQLPELGDAGGITYVQERIIGEQVVSAITADPSFVDDAILQEYTEGVWRKLLAVAMQNRYASDAMSDRFVWSLHMLREPTVNAFVTPGGVMGVHLGLLATVDSTDELASVLAHETSHVTQRHISRLVDKRKRQTPLQIATILATAIAASQGDGQMAQAAMIGGQALTIQQQINFTRGMEQEADRIGFLLVKQAGYSPQGFVSMFDKLYQANRLNDDGSYPYLRTHPLSRQRMADMQARVGLKDGGSRIIKSTVVRRVPQSAAANTAHSMLKIRAKLLARQEAEVWREALRHAQVIQQSGGPSKHIQDKLSSYYGAAFASLRLGDVPQAQKWVAALQSAADEQRADAQQRRQIRLLATEIALQAKQPDAALQALGLAPQTLRPETLMKAQAYLQKGTASDVQKAAQLLRDWVAVFPKDAVAQELLAQAYEAKGQLLRAVGARADAELAHYQYARAANLLRGGQTLFRTGKDTDLIEAQVLDAKLREVMRLQERHEQALEG